MPEYMTAPSRLSSRRHTAALLGIVALAFFQVSIAAHQFQHVSDHGLNVCHICSTHNQLDDAPVSAKLPVELPIADNMPASTEADLLESAFFVAPYLSRAPPIS